MFDIASTELLLIVVVAVIVIGPKELPRALYKLGQVLGKARGMARHFRTGVDAMVREAELEELQKQWAKQNEEIMRNSRTIGPDGSMTPPVTAQAEASPAKEDVSGADQAANTIHAPSAPLASADAPEQVTQPTQTAQPSLPLGAPEEAPGTRSA